MRWAAWPRRKASVQQADARVREVQPQDRAGAQARCRQTASWSAPAPATASRSSRPRPSLKSLEAQLDTARGVLAQSRGAVAQAAAGERQVRQRLGGKVGADYAPVAQVRAQLENARWQLEQTTVVAPSDGYAINVQLRPGSFTAAFPITPAMTFVENSYQVIALYDQNELHQVEPGNEAEFYLPTNPGHIFKAKVDSIVWAQGQGQSRQQRGAADDGLGPVAARAFPGQADGRRARCRRSSCPPARSATARIYTEHVEFLHILRKVLAARQHQDRLPGPEAALTMANHTRFASICTPPRRHLLALAMSLALAGCALNSPPDAEAADRDRARPCDAAARRSRPAALATAVQAGWLTSFNDPRLPAAGRRGAGLQRRSAHRRGTGRGRRGGAEGGRRRAGARRSTSPAAAAARRHRFDRASLGPARLGFVGDRPLGPGSLRPRGRRRPVRVGSGRPSARRGRRSSPRWPRPGSSPPRASSSDVSSPTC